MALNGFLQRLGLQKDLRTRPREGVWGREEDKCVSVCVRAWMCGGYGGERDGADAGSI